MRSPVFSSPSRDIGWPSMPLFGDENDPDYGIFDSAVSPVRRAKYGGLKARGDMMHEDGRPPNVPPSTPQPIICSPDKSSWLYDDVWREFEQYLTSPLHACSSPSRDQPFGSPYNNSAPFFPPPASPPPYAPKYSTHIPTADFSNTTLFSKPRVGHSSPFLSLPSTEPLDDDPFVVRKHVPCPESPEVTTLDPKFIIRSARFDRSPRKKARHIGTAKSPSTKAKRANKPTLSSSLPLGILAPSVANHSSSPMPFFGYPACNYSFAATPIPPHAQAYSSTVPPTALPSSSCRPTPALTDSFSTPSISSSPSTPGHGFKLFPSPDIVGSSPYTPFASLDSIFARVATPTRAQVRPTRGALSLVSQARPKPQSQKSRDDGLVKGEVEADTESEVVVEAEQPQCSPTAACAPQVCSEHQIVTDSNEIVESQGQDTHLDELATAHPQVESHTGKRTRESDGDDQSLIEANATNVSKKRKHNAQNDDVVSNSSTYAFGRSTRSRTRAVAALFASGTGRQTPAPAPARGAHPGAELEGDLVERPIEKGSPVQLSNSKARPISGDPAPSKTSKRGTVSRGQILQGVSNPDMGADGGKPSEPSPNVCQIPAELLPRPDPSAVFGSDNQILRRTFPKDLPIHRVCTKWYIKFPVSAYLHQGDPARIFLLGEEAAARRDAFPGPIPHKVLPNAAGHFNLYTPRFVRGIGVEKVGLCPICVEPVWRGGQGRSVLFNTKISAYNYHMQYYHGISPKSGLPFSPPVAFRHTKRTNVKSQERASVEEGKCHACNKWIAIESPKEVDVMVPELYWWKHAATCHGESRLVGDEDLYIEDGVYFRLREYESTPGQGAQKESCDGANDWKPKPPLPVAKSRRSNRATRPRKTRTATRVGAQKSVPATEAEQGSPEQNELSPGCGSDSDLTDLDDGDDQTKDMDISDEDVI